MRKFICTFGDEVDLDNPKTYKSYPNTRKELEALLYQQIGYVIMYMDYFPSRKGFYPKEKQKPNFVKHTNGKKYDIANSSYDQRLRIEKFIKLFCKNERKWNEDKKIEAQNILWLKEQLFLFYDETENMC